SGCRGVDHEDLGREGGDAGRLACERERRRTSMTVLSPDEATPIRAAVDGSEFTNAVRWCTAANSARAAAIVVVPCPPRASVSESEATALSCHHLPRIRRT